MNWTPAALVATILVSCTSCTAKIDNAVDRAAAGVHVSVYPTSAGVPPGEVQPFSASVTGTANPAVQWSIREGTRSGQVSGTGLFSAAADAPLGTVLHVVATSVADPNVSDAAVVTISSVASTSARYLGVNLGWINPATVNQIFGNVAKQGRPWVNATAGNETLVPLDVRGWPTTDARLGFFEAHSFPAYMATSGYKLRFKGQASLSGMNLTITNKAYDAATNTTTADIAVNSVDNTWVTFTSTKRNPSDAAGNGVTEVSIMRPGYTLSDYWNKDFVAALQPFSLIRAMQSGGPGFDMWGTSGAVGVMGNRDTTWSTRQKPAVGYTFNGPAWEEWVILANLLGKDIWICLPYRVDADYVTKLAQLLRYGSDGVDPYTSPTHDPSTWDPTNTTWYPGLLPNRTVYVEWVNELWNHGYGYPTSSWNDSDYAAEITPSAGDPHHLNFDGAGSSDRRVAWKTVWASQLFRGVWGDAAMGTRIRIALPNQGGWGQWARHQAQLTYIDKVWGPTSPYATIDGITVAKQPPSYYLHNLTGSMYVHTLASTTTLDGIFADLNRSLSTPGGVGDTNAESNSVVQRIGYGDTLAAKYGLKFSTYEAGIEVQSSALMTQADADIRMKTLHHDMFHDFYGAANADVYVYFWLVGSGGILDVGLSPDLRDTNTLRWQAVKEFAGGGQ